jgi:hypothetical protein
MVQIRIIRAKQSLDANAAINFSRIKDMILYNKHNINNI